MKLNLKSLILFLVLLVYSCACAYAGTVDVATLEPPSISGPSGAPVSFSFSALNDKAFVLKSYSISISFDAGLTVSNLATDPISTSAAVDTGNRVINLLWSNIPPGLEMKASFDVTGSGGAYSLIPSQSTYSDGSKGKKGIYNGTCNSAQVEFAAAPPPTTPYNVRSSVVTGGIEIDWSYPSESQAGEYRIYRRTEDTQFDQSSYFTSNYASYTDNTVQPGVIYYYCVSAVNGDGVVGDFSTETADVIYDSSLGTFDIQDRVNDNYAVTTAGGDFNGDGVSDLAVGLPLSGTNKNHSGKVYIFYGNSTQSGPDLILYGEADGDRFGAALAATDMNNDGDDELIVGAPDSDVELTYPVIGTEYDAGKVYVYTGGANLSATPLTTFEGQWTKYLLGERLGWSVAAVGDINGDGFNDVVIGGPYGGDDHHGRVTVIFGGSGHIGGTSGIIGPNVGMLLGSALTAAGDVNKDGYGDFLIGADGENKVYLVLGDTMSHVLTPIGFSYSNRNYFNNPIVMAGADINGDDYSDLIIGDSIFFGGATVDTAYDIKFDGGPGPYQPLGDADADGFQDLFLGNAVLWGGAAISIAPVSVSSPSGYQDVDNDNLVDVLVHDAAAEQIQVKDLKPYINAPKIRIESPQSPYTWDAEVVISGHVDGACSQFSVAGTPVALTVDNQFSQTVDLRHGSNSFELTGISPEGYIGKTVVAIQSYVPQLSIEFDSALSLDPGAGLMRIFGHTSRQAASVDVNGVAATLNGNNFTADITLAAPDTMITATAVDNIDESATVSISAALLSQSADSAAAGFVKSSAGVPLAGATVTMQDAGGSHSVTTNADGTYSIATSSFGSVTLTFNSPGYIGNSVVTSLSSGLTAIVDTVLAPIPPLSVYIYSPEDNATLAAHQVTVEGNCSHDDIASVTVNGVAAELLGPELYFRATVPLSLGTNTITTTATDIYNQTATDSITVTATQPPPGVSFSAAPAAIDPGASSTLSWNVIDADTVSIDQNIGSVGPSGTTDVSPAGTTTYTLTATGPGGTTTQSVTVTVLRLPVVNNFAADPVNIALSEASTLSWNVSWADTVSIDNNIGPVGPSGTHNVSPSVTTTYTLTATGPGGTASASVTVIVRNLPHVQFVADPLTIIAGDSAGLGWICSNADTCTITPEVGDVALSGTEYVRPRQTTTYTLTATNADGSTSASVVVHVMASPTLTADRIIIDKGESATLHWNATTGDSCEITPDIGVVPFNGELAVSPQDSTLYTLTVHKSNLTAKAYVRIHVRNGTYYGNPTPVEQLHIEFINRARANPVAEAARFNIDLNEGPPSQPISSDPVQPLACNAKLLESARLHSRDMVDNQYYSHDSLDGRTVSDRIEDAGFWYLEYAENIAMGYSSRDPFDELNDSIEFHELLFVDPNYPGRGHRINLLKPNLKELGIGISRGPHDPYPYSIKFTCDFGTSFNEMRSYLLGVVYDDLNADGQYNAGEGLGDVQVLIVETGAATVTASAGGYRIPLVAGDYTVRATLADGRQFEKSFSINDQNVKVDFDLVPLPVIAFSATPDQFLPGEQVTLAWTVTGADSCQITPDINTVALSGSTLVSPTEPTTYTLTATGPGGTISRSVDLAVKVPAVVFAADPRGIAGGDSSTLSWNVSGADTVSIDQGIGTVAATGSRQVSPAAATTYTLTAQGAGGTTTASATVWLDTEAPVVTDISPAGGTTAESQNGWVTYTATVDDNASGLCSITLLDDQGTDISELLDINGPIVSWISDSTGPPSFTLVLEDCAGNAASTVIGNTTVAVPQDVDYGLDPEAGPDFVGGNIRITNGNVVEARSDLSVPSPNQLGLGFNAYYNSRSTRATALGHGWTHTYSTALNAGVDLGGQSYARIIDASGRAHYFSSTSPYAPAFNEKTQLAFQGGQYVWQRLDGSRFGFNTDGTLDWMDDAVGNRLALAYSAGRLQTVSDTASGRSLSFQYSGGQLASVSGPVTAAVPDGVWVSFGYDGDQNLTGVTYADGSGLSYTYADPYDPNDLTLKQDNAGHQLAAWEYDNQDRVRQSYMPDDRSVQLVYAGSDQVQVTDAYGTLRTYSLTQIHGRIKVARLQGPAVAPYYDSPAIRWQYDDQLNLTEVEMAGGTSDSPMNTVHRYTDFDARGNPGTVIQAWNTPDERTITFAYHPVLNTILTREETSVLDAAGQKETIYDYDDPAAPGDDPNIYNENPTNLVRRIIEKGLTRDSAGAQQPYTYVTTLTYNGRGQLLASDGPLAGAGDTTAYAYDPSNGDLTSVSRPLVGATTFSAYDAAGRPGTITDINAVAEDFTYDGRGRVVESINQANGSSRSTTYTDGLPTFSADADGVTQAISYEPEYGRPDTITDHRGNTTVFGYDSRGNRTSQWRYAVSDPSTPTTSARWSYDHPDLPGRLYRAFNPDPNQPGQEVYTQYDYDLAGNTAAVTDPKGQSTGYVYDSLNRVIEITQSGGTTYMAYDSRGNLASVTDAEGRQTVYAYDDMDRRVSESSPDAGTTNNSYDAAGNLVYSEDGRGVGVAYTPDELGRTRRIDYPLYAGQPAYSVTYTYDGGPGGNGRLTAMSDASGSTSWDYSLYDAQGIAAKTTVMDGFSFEITETRTPGGRLSRLIYPSGRVVDIQRSECTCSISGVSTTYGAETTTLLAGMQYQPWGMPNTMDIGGSGALNVDNRFDEAGRLTAANPGTANERTYGHDANGNTVNIQLAATPWQSQTYSYDTLNRVTSAVGDFGFIDFSYDKTGNRLTRTHNGARTDYSYTPGTNRLERISPDSAAATDYTYDGHGNLTMAGSRQYTYDQANRLVRADDTSLAAVYFYNGLGQRVAKTVDGTTTYYHYDLDGKMIAETPAGGTVSQGTEHIYKGNSLLAQVDVQNGVIYTYHTNYLGAVHQLTDHNGTVVWEAVYQPFGETVINAGSTVVNNWRMPGQYYDQETGLHYNDHRYYDPGIGRYLTPDPIGLEGGINLYAYVQNNPVNYIDPTGEFLISGSVAVGYAGYVAGTAIAAGIVYYGAPIAADIGTWLGNKLFNESDNDSGEETRARPPTGSRPIDQTPWSGDHQGIKGEVGAGPADNVVISPDGHVWVENPDGSFTDHGPASDYTNSGKPSGRRGKDRKCRR